MNRDELSSAAAQAYRQYQAVRYFSAIDGLRCASILAVLWFHTAVGWNWLPAAGCGYLGVDMFFVISGFLIVTLLLREKDRHGTISLRRFYVRRSLRIFPIYYAILLGMAVIYGWLRPYGVWAADFWHNLPYNLTYLSNWIEDATILRVAWSLASEEQFYLVWPPLERFLSRRWLWAALGLVLVVNQLLNFGLLDGMLWNLFATRRSSLNILQITFTPICLGVGLAHLLHSPRSFQWLHRALFWRGAPLVALILIVALCSFPDRPQGAMRLGVQLGIAALLASCVIREDNLLQPVLTWPIIRRIGVISYGIYLYHMFAKSLVRWLAGGLAGEMPGAWFLLTLLITLVMAEISFRYFETPLLRLKNSVGKVPFATQGAAKEFPGAFASSAAADGTAVSGA